MTTYLILKLVHVLAAILAVGTNLTYFFWLSRTKADPELAARILPNIRALDARFANPAYVVLPVTGVLMVLDADLGFTTFWILATIVLYAVLGAVAGASFAPSLRRQVELATTGADPAAYASAARRTTVTGVVTMLPAAAILYLMVLKPTP